MKNQDAARFLDAVHRGDPEAAAEVVRRFEPYLRRVIRLRLRERRLGHLVDSVDICQSIWVEFLGRLAAGRLRFESTRQVRGLLVKMAFDKVEDKARRERRHLGHLPDEWEPVSPHDTPGRHAARQDLVRAVRERLSDRERRIFDLRSRGHAWEEIAGEVGGDPHAVRMMLARAVARVRRELERREPGDEH